jgi:hypothetical protein
VCPARDTLTLPMLLTALFIEILTLRNYLVSQYPGIETEART